MAAAAAAARDVAGRGGGRQLREALVQLRNLVVKVAGTLQRKRWAVFVAALGHGGQARRGDRDPDTHWAHCTLSALPAHTSALFRGHYPYRRLCRKGLRVCPFTSRRQDRSKATMTQVRAFVLLTLGRRQQQRG